MTGKRLLLIALSPFLLAVGALGLATGLNYLAGNDPALELIQGIDAISSSAEEASYLAARCLFAPLQIVFIVLVVAIGLFLYRRRDRVARWVVSSTTLEGVERSTTYAADPILGTIYKLLPGEQRDSRRRTLEQLVSSIFALVLVVGVAFLILSQFVFLSDLAVVLTALTSALAWGARMPVADVLGGISTIVEDNYGIGDRIRYKNFAAEAGGRVEAIDLRYSFLRSDTGDLTSVPHGVLRVFHNDSRADRVGVYATAAVPASQMEAFIDRLMAVAEDSTTLVPGLVEPWRVVCLDGLLADKVELTLFGMARSGEQEAVQLALNGVFWQQMHMMQPDSGEAGEA